MPAVASTDTCDLCGEHIAAERAKELRRAWEYDRANEKAAKAAALEDLRAVLDRINDPVEKLLAAMTTTESYLGPPAGLVGRWQTDVTALCSDLPRANFYDSAVVARWYASRALSDGLLTVPFAQMILRRKMFGGYRTERLAAVQAWEFPEAIARTSRWGNEQPTSLYILQDGKMFTPGLLSAAGQEEPSVEILDLPPVILKKMAENLGLRTDSADR